MDDSTLILIGLALFILSIVTGVRTALALRHVDERWWKK